MKNSWKMKDLWSSMPSTMPTEMTKARVAMLLDANNVSNAVMRIVCRMQSCSLPGHWRQPPVVVQSYIHDRQIVLINNASKLGVLRRRVLEM